MYVDVSPQPHFQVLRQLQLFWGSYNKTSSPSSGAVTKGTTAAIYDGLQRQWRSDSGVEVRRREATENLESSVLFVFSDRGERPLFFPGDGTHPETIMAAVRSPPV
ncbi:hypothetical protein MRB53_032442 [Persea americana]|uniref:Uncharacterized protein n=1 Tax=Persea americana TaxID=3435 RepID=A0ACC2KSZ4_PERAE|nr:hypothetical protein MRB53_032442 [Persea americana]